MTDATPGVNERLIDPLTAILATASYGAVEMQELRARASTGTVSPSDVCLWLRDAEQHYAEIADAAAHLNRLLNEQRAGSSERPGVTGTKQGRRVLVVDNEPAILRVVRRMLRSHEVECVAGAREALARIEAGADYDVILCDIVMPGMTGLELYEALLDKHAAIARRLVFVTAGTDTAKTAELRRLEPMRFIDKPFHAATLAHALERVAPAV